MNPPLTMEELTSLVSSLPDLRSSWLSSPATLGLKLRAVSSRLTACLEAVAPEDVPGLLDLLVGVGEVAGVEGVLSLLGEALALAKDKQKERSKDAGDFLRDVAELLGLLVKQHPQMLRSRLPRLVQLGRALFFLHPAAKVRVEGLLLLEACVEVPGVEDRLRELGLEQLVTQLRSALAARCVPSVLSQLRRLLGRMARALPGLMAPHQQDLRNSYVREVGLALRATTSSLDLGLVEGTLRGLHAILDSFPLEDDEEESREQVYEVLRRLCRRPEQEEGGSSVRRGAMRAALELFASHCVLFSRQVVAEARYWHPLLEAWLGGGRDDAKVGWRAMDAFIDTVGRVLAETAVEGSPPSLVFLVSRLQQVLLAPGSSPKAVSLAIQGWVSLVAFRSQFPCTHCMLALLWLRE